MNRKVLVAIVIAGLLAAVAISFCQSRDRVDPDPATAGGTAQSSDKGSPLAPEADVQRELAAEQPVDVRDAAPEERTGSLRIRVVDATRGAPVAGIGLLLRDRGPNPPPPRRVGADDDGEAVVTALQPGSYRVGTDRYHSANEQVRVVAGRETRVTLTLDDCIHLTGLVVDDVGTPVAGAAVLLGRLGTSDWRVVAHSDGDGRFAIPAAPRIVKVAARAVDHAPSPFRTVTAGAGADVDVRIVLPGEGGTVSGVVLGPDGHGVAGAVVSIGTRQPYDRVITLPDGARGSPPPQPRARSDESGRFVIEAIAPGRRRVTVRSESFAPWTGEVEVVAHSDTPVTIRLTSGVVCEGTVRSEDGELLADVRIRYDAAGNAAGRNAFSDADGAFRLEGLPPDELLTVVADGGEHGRATVEIQGAPGETVVWHATLSRGLVLSGRVLGGEGAPLEDAFVMATAGSWRQFTWADADGAFVFAGCPEGEAVSLEVTAKGYLPLQKDGIDPAAGPLLLKMAYVGADIRIVGRVVGPDGTPVADARITVGRDGSAVGAFHTSSADGEIAIDDVRPGLLHVRISAGAFAHFVSAERRVGSGETWDLGTVHLSHGGLLEVDLQRTSETEDARIYVSIHRGGQRLSWLSGSDTRPGSMRSERLPPGDFELRARGPAVAPVTRPFSIQADRTTRLELRPEPAVPCAVTLTVPAGREDVRLVEYRIESEDGVQLSDRAGRRQDGTFALATGLKPGRHTLHAWTDDGLAGRLAFDVQESADTLQMRLALR